jgi:hypothetical protein
MCFLEGLCLSVCSGIAFWCCLPIDDYNWFRFGFAVDLILRIWRRLERELESCAFSCDLACLIQSPWKIVCINFPFWFPLLHCLGTFSSTPFCHAPSDLFPFASTNPDKIIVVFELLRNLVSIGYSWLSLFACLPMLYRFSSILLFIPSQLVDF